MSVLVAVALALLVVLYLVWTVVVEPYLFSVFKWGFRGLWALPPVTAPHPRLCDTVKEHVSGHWGVLVVPPL
ncbi:hypothetical protein F2Q68_00002452 [Brassica cretica]|uniref:Uncharacterized protein n=1 Tax=Brassica cretica TaxID=69181 RepID=A0A8S9JLP0_BRACR|nr:hypothetical protein F2Q68_00002452 [Brassica cretica]